MRLPELARSITRRFRRPATWAVVVGFGLVWVPARLLAGVPFERMGVWEFILPSLFLVGHLALAAAPWQWTGNDRPGPNLWQGFLQALPWNALWVLLVLWGVQDHVRPARPQREPRPVAQEERPERPAPRPEGAEPDGKGPAPRPPAADESAPREPRPPAREQGPEDRPRPEREAEVDRRPEGAGGRRPDREPPGQEQRPRRADDRPAPPPAGPRPEWMLLFLNLPFAMVLGWFLAEKERVERIGAEARERERQARARALQSQLHPHVLFNVLAGLTELVHEDPDAAEEALVGLAELLRMLMRHGSALSLPLGQERALLKRYLEIEAIRLGNRLEVQWTWQEELDRIMVPPLLLQPLVENAVKHGIAPCADGGLLRVEAIRTGTGLLLRVVNSGQPLNRDARDGTGLGNLRERLSLLPEPRPVLDLRQEGNWTVAELRIDGTLGT